ncbi:threonine synthase [Bacteroidota bacterium]
MTNKINYINTRGGNESISFKTATTNGLALDGGLYVPNVIPTLPPSFFDTIEQKSDAEIGFEVLLPLVENSLPKEALEKIVSETLSFSLPVVEVAKDTFVLELFHGPTQAFKDVGARFMSRCMSVFSDEKELTVLVATSGDTGSAVANGFYNVPGISVKILFPKGKVSPYQEFQMTSLGKNIQAIEVDGTFDDCQALVKQAFQDKSLRGKVSLSSANSINISRLLPQMLYYFIAYKQIKATLGNKKLVISVPSGNFGNITAGLIAQRMGLPISRFVAANNANDTFFKYLQSGNYEPKPSVTTVSNAMDVGAPSNFERIQYLFNNSLESIKSVITSYSFSDAETIEEIKSCYAKNQYILDPHGAVGKLALDQSLGNDEIGIFLETAHPLKFAEIVQKAIPDYAAKTVDLSNCSKTPMANSYAELTKQLVG